tara:strand:+ start:724 stop:2034 length:1311 start_codon:yes stop_codon:yes gene_type:complete
MTSIINNSNSNSALVNTLESSDSMVNPNIYSTKEIYPTSATTWTKNEKSNGTSTNGNSMNFNLNKYGIIEQILLNYTKNLGAVSTGAAASPVTTFASLKTGDIFDVIDRIELLSASRVISILTAADLAAQFSNLSTSQYEPIRQTAIAARTSLAVAVAQQAVGASVGLNYVCPLVFGFMKDINLQLNSSFLEPLSIRVTFSANAQYPADPITAVPQGTVLTEDYITNTFLNIRYKSYPEAATAQILASNYSSPELVQVSTRYYDENPVFQDNDMGGGSVNDTISVDLRNTDCVEAFYIMARIVNANGTFGYPVIIKNITYTGSGQEIMNLDELTLPYARLTENGFSSSLMRPSDDIANLQNVYKIQVGLYENDGGGVLSNTQSLREINAPRIKITLDTKTLSTGAGTRFRVDVMEDCSAIYSTSSAIGRLSLALSN